MLKKDKKIYKKSGSFKIRIFDLNLFVFLNKILKICLKLILILMEFYDHLNKNNEL